MLDLSHSGSNVILVSFDISCDNIHFVFETALFFYLDFNRCPMSFTVTVLIRKSLIDETAVWPNFFLMNFFFALNGSKLFIIICCRIRI